MTEPVPTWKLVLLLLVPCAVSGLLFVFCLNPALAAPPPVVPGCRSTLVVVHPDTSYYETACWGGAKPQE